MLYKRLQFAGKDSPEFEARARVLAVCGWSLHVMPPLRSAQLSRWDGRKAGGVDPHSAVLCCTTCGVRAGVWSFLPPVGDLGGPTGAFSIPWLPDQGWGLVKSKVSRTVTQR